MTLIFHQNLQRFGGGGSSSKVSDLVGTLTKTRTVAKDVIAVAGFTEVTNASTSVPQLKKLFSALKIDQYIIAGVGDTALTGATEYISIGWKSGEFQLSEVGVVQAKTASSFTYVTEPSTGWVQDGDEYVFPSGESTDSRGILYVSGQANGDNWVFGFMHNMYQVGDISLFTRSLGKITQGLAEKHDASVVIGGDFNVNPVGTRNDYGHSCAAVDPADGVYYYTTMHHTYDWWYVDDNSLVANKDASIGYAEEYTITTKAGKPKTMLYPSDHFPVLLKCPI